MGKMALLLVMGMYIILGTIMRNNNSVQNEAVANLTDYYGHANSRHIAASGANMAVSTIFRDKTWKSGWTDLDFSGGTADVTVVDDTTLGKGGVIVRSVSNYLGYKDTVIVKLNIAFFSKYLLFFNDTQGGYYITGDTIDGPMHSNTRLECWGSPVFKGRVSMQNGPYKQDGSGKAEFWGGYEYGVKIDMPGHLNDLKQAAGKEGFIANSDLWLTFNGTSDVTYRTTKTGKDTTVPLANLTKNGVIAAKGEIHVKGTLDGSATIVSLKESKSGKIWIDDDIGVKNDPIKDPTSSQFLGIVSEGDIIVSNNTENNNNCNITASLYSMGTFYAEDYNSRGKAGTLSLKGSLTANKDGYTGTMSGGKIVNGFQLKYKYDERLLQYAPPEFPLTDRYQILSWWE